MNKLDQDRAPTVSSNYHRNQISRYRAMKERSWSSTNCKVDVSVPSSSCVLRRDTELMLTQRLHFISVSWISPRGSMKLIKLNKQNCIHSHWKHKGHTEFHRGSRLHHLPHCVLTLTMAGLQHPGGRLSSILCLNETVHRFTQSHLKAPMSAFTFHNAYFNLKKPEHRFHFTQYLLIFFSPQSFPKNN